MAEDLWRDVATAYDRSFASLCGGTTTWLAERVTAGSTVLDVGCGTGRLASTLAAAGHRVAAVDPDPEMVAITRARASVPAVVGGLPCLPVPDASVGLALANFVLNHVDDPRSAAAGLARALQPGGRAVATIWPGFPPPQALMWSEVLDAAGAVRPEVPRLPEHLDFERTTDGLAGLFTGAGLAPVEFATPSWEWRVDPEDLWAGLTTVGNFGVVWRAQSDEVRARMRASYGLAQQPWRDDDALCFPVECVLVEARRADVAPAVAGRG